jgi:hypothetical protein
MRYRSSHFPVYLLLVLCIHAAASPPAWAATKIVDERTWSEKAKDTASESVTSIGVNLAVQLVTGWMHDGLCNPPARDTAAEFFCGVVGGLSGKTDEQWKAKVEAKLQEISGKLDVLTDGQRKLQMSIDRLDTTLNYEFENIAPRSKAFNVLTKIEALWKQYTRLMGDAKYATDKKELLDFAKDVKNQNLHAELAELSVVLEKPILDAESVFRYPYVKWQKQNPTRYAYLFDPSAIYDVAEKKFLDLRMYQQKGSLMYLFAAETLESHCEADPANCTSPPISSKRFKENFEKDMRDQIAAFNAALDWFVLVYSEPHFGDPDLMLPAASTQTLMRANFFTATLLGGPGMWGRVYSMGNQWNGAITMNCDGRTMNVTRADLEYKVPVQPPSSATDNSDTLDWWVSRGNNAVYDEVHFAREWRVLHYRVPAAQPGPCRLQSVAGVMPWAEPFTQLVEVPGSEGKAKYGSFLGVQRAGGTFALVSGEWGGHSQPYEENGGDATKKDIRNTWHVDKNHKWGPQIGIYHGGRGDFSGGDTKVYAYRIVHSWNPKKIVFPEDRALKLHLLQSTDCANACRNNAGNERFVMQYDIQNSKSDPGYLHALAGIYLSAEGGDSKSDSYAGLRNRMRNGVMIDGSYSDAKDNVTKTKLVEDDQLSADIVVDPGKQYNLQYMLDYQLVTYTKGWDAVNFWYRAKLTPIAVYLTRR